MRKKVLIIPTMVLPIPDTKGGAIERLLTMLIEENEKEGLVDFYVLSVSEERAEKRAKIYKHTKLLYQKRSPIFIEKLFMYTYVGFRKVFGIRLPYFNPNYLGLPYLVKRLKPEVVVMEGSGGENLVSLLKWVDREKLFLHLHHEFSPNITLDKTYATVLSPSSFIKNRWDEKEHFLPQETRVVMNGIDEKRFLQKDFNKEEVRKKAGFSKDDFLILFCGRLIPEKGIKELISAFKKVSLPFAKLLVIGSADFGNNTETDFVTEIRAMIADEENIRHFGYVSNAEMKEYYRMSDILVVPTLIEEAAGMVAIEAMFCGLPIIATNTGGLPEYTGEAALLVEKNGITGKILAERLAEKMSYLYENREVLETMSLKGQEQAKNFTKNHYYKTYLKSIGIIEG